MKAESLWIAEFKKYFFKELLKFSHGRECTVRSSQATTSQQRFLTYAEEEQLLVEAQKIKTRKNCKCKLCSIEEVQREVYKIVHNAVITKSYPSSWDEKQQADSQWMREFEERHASEILERFLHDCNCKYKEPRTPCLTLDDERWLLIQIDSIWKTKFNCDCKSCLVKEVALRVYEFVREYQKSHPQTWDENRQADSQWLRISIIV